MPWTLAMSCVDGAPDWLWWHWCELHVVPKHWQRLASAHSAWSRHDFPLTRVDLIFGLSIAHSTYKTDLCGACITGNEARRLNFCFFVYGLLKPFVNRFNQSNIHLLVGQSRVNCCCSVDCTGKELRRCELTVDVDDVDEAVDEGR